MEESISTLGSANRPETGRSTVPGREKPKLVFMGERGGGKSSIREVVFHKLDPELTLLLGRTRKPTQDAFNSFIDLEVWDLPGSMEADTFSMPLTSVGAIIFVIDAQSRYADGFPKLAHAIVQAHTLNPQLHFEVFLHKIDSYANDYRQELLNEVKDGLTEELAELELNLYDESLAPLTDLSNRLQYRLTSVYDYSIYEALSRVIMKVIPQQAALENLMNLLVQQSSIEKCFLFDVWTKLYIATDSAPVDSTTLSLCSELMDLFADFSELYGVPSQPSPVTRPKPNINAPIPSHLLSTSTTLPQPLHSSTSTQSVPSSQFRSPSKPSRETSPTRQPFSTLPHQFQHLSSFSKLSTTTTPPAPLSLSNSTQQAPPHHHQLESEQDTTQPLPTASPFSMSKMATSHVRLDADGGGAKVVSYYEINSHLSLVCVTHDEIMKLQAGLIEYKLSRFLYVFKDKL